MKSLDDKIIKDIQCSSTLKLAWKQLFIKPFRKQILYESTKIIAINKSKSPLT